MGARSGRAKNDETGSGNIILTKDFHCVGKRGDFRGDPGLAFGLFNKKAEFSEGFDPDRPKCEEVLGVNDKDYVINVSQNLDDVFGVPVRKGERGLVEEVVNCSTKMRAEDGGGEAFALKYALCDFKVRERRGRDRNV